MDDAEFFEVDELARALHRARQGVVGVSRFGRHATGWLITDDLVVIPDHRAWADDDPDDSLFFCRLQGDGMPAELVLTAPEQSEVSISVLRLRDAPVPGGALNLSSSASGRWGQPILLFHYPLAMESLRVSSGELHNGGQGQGRLMHTAKVGPGSAGGPITDARGFVLGMTLSTSIYTVVPGPVGVGPTIGAILGQLGDSAVAREIRDRHNLVDTTKTHTTIVKLNRRMSPFDTALLYAAVRWTFDPAALTAREREQLAPLVTDSAAPAWTLRSAEREKAVVAAPSLGVLRGARDNDEIDDPRQAVIDRILAGPPYRLDEVDEAALPYWLQAVRWFGPVLPGLPSPAEVARVLERRRHRSRLTAIAGPGFRGRDAELGLLRSWLGQAQAGPMVVTGIGGIGKSALVARFASELPAEALLLWLDFDRADLAPDDAESVTALIAGQLAVQVDGFVPPAAGDDPWEALGAAFAGRPVALMVLDGFEVAQHVREHGQLWPVLERLGDQVPGLKVIVSGRSGVPGLALHRRPAAMLPLTGLDRAEAAAWLREHGVTDQAVLDRVLDLAGGIPLALRLAVRYLRSGGTAADLPTTLPKAMVEGLLYTRILERVMDPALMLIARDALVLRRLTPELIDGVLADRIPEGLTAAEVFERLAYELALVDARGADPLTVALDGPGSELALRPEVRAATLALLETDDPDRVRVIDERTARWYAERPLTAVADRTELVYHLLRRDDFAGAAEFWADGCAPLLDQARDELSAEARSWLRRRVGGTGAGLGAWEADALARLRSALARGVDRAVPEILAERSGRTDDSPLVLYDAWVLAERGEQAQARDLLDRSYARDELVMRDREVLAAWLAARAGDRPDADYRLRELAREATWQDVSAPVSPALLVWAGRVRLTVDLAAEAELLRGSSAKVHTPQLLTRAHVVSPRLADRLGRHSTSAVEIPSLGLSLGQFRHYLTLTGALPRTSSPSWLRRMRWDNSQGPWLASEIPEWKTNATAANLTVLGFRRWTLVADGLLLSRACEEVLSTEHLPTAASAAIGGALAAYHSLPLLFPTQTRALKTIEQVIHPLYRRTGPNQRQVDLSLARELGLSSDLLAGSNVSLPGLPEIDSSGKTIFLHLAAPDPLEILFRLVAGLPVEEW
ncbi:hypothetical protein DMB66_03735 [Actinoplanes sp. ATCC 53533]|uniref:trypsin-like peptidase domain-containing protein n=1 Tax=Actinoplanes sp. ATCC 53533 TaxID=1288362 RepID=UPI000F76B255|nr:trypsin-like peptidase domain-containing protein [Actinoplanes sp. ATCC 53533]RSM73151.1 hypothetical protein DMB66_03735 [Actinoplanes sp. ATCC 53533]